MSVTGLFPVSGDHHQSINTMKKPSSILILFALTFAAFAVEVSAKEASTKEAKPAPERDKQPSAKESSPCEKESAAKQKECEKLGNGTAANACKEAVKHNEKNCKAAEEAGK